MGEAAREEAPAKEPEGDEPGRLLATALDAISCLVSDSLLASLFPLKWQLIRDRLNRLHAGLADITVDDDDSRCAALLRGVAETAREGLELVPRSQGRHYGGGKLRLRSDLDVLSAALDAHAARLEDLHASGALARGARALVVPRPPPGASRDDVRFYVRDLLARLRVGGADMRREAAAALNEALRGGDGERFARAVVASDDGVGVLVALLECPDVQDEALEAVAALAGHDAHRADLVVGGVVAPVVRVLDDGAAVGGGAPTRERAARVLCRLTENSDNAWAEADGGGELACRALRNLAGVDEIRKHMVADAGAVPVLVSLLSPSRDDAAQIQATELLAAMAAAGDGSVLVHEGAVESLVRALDPALPRSTKSREAALRATDALCFASPAATDRLLAAGFMDRVLSLLRSDDSALHQVALKATHRLCQVSEEAKKAMGDAGFVPELLGVLLSAKSSPEARETAAEALCAIVSAAHRNRKRFVQEDGVAQVMQQLPPDEEKQPSPTTRFLLSTLVHLADSSSGRRKIVSSEHFRNLERLAAANVPDAKRIVKKLGGSKLRTIFHVILGDKH